MNPTTTCIHFGDVDRDLRMHDMKMNMNMFETPVGKPNTPPYNACDAGIHIKNSGFLGQIPSDDQVSLQREPAFQRLGCSQKMQEVALAPYNYIKSLPSKGLRDVLIDALNLWFKVPDASRDIIREVIALLHTSSLMFDDIEDGSALRRGKPTTHKIFGVAQTINSSTYVLMTSIMKARLLSNKACVDILVDGVSYMLEGQGMDLQSTYLAECPHEFEYLHMVDRKTGGLFKIAYELMRAESAEREIPSLDVVMTVLGRYFQIRDDYMNLTSGEYSGQKGFCEDLDEGKFSYPLIHCLGGTGDFSPATSCALELKSILALRSSLGECGLPDEVKRHMLDLLRDAGSLNFTKLALDQLERDLRAEIAQVEGAVGVNNPILTGLVDKMKV